jgi:hypothetical protein
LIISIHYTAPSEKKIWSSIGIAFAIIYAILVSITYFTQLAIVFNPPNLPPDIIKMFDYQEPGSWMFVVDMLGYGFMTLSTLFTAFVFEKDKPDKWLRIIYIIHGIFFVPTIIFPLLPLGSSSEESDIFGAIALLFWCGLFIPLSGLTCRYFMRNELQEEKSEVD